MIALYRTLKVLLNVLPVENLFSFLLALACTRSVIETLQGHLLQPELLLDTECWIAQLVLVREDVVREQGVFASRLLTHILFVLARHFVLAQDRCDALVTLYAVFAVRKADFCGLARL